MTKRLLASLLALSFTFALVACNGDAGKKPSEPEKKTEQGKDEGKEAPKGEVSENKASIVVQAEKDWLPHYQAAVERVKAKFPNAEIKLKEIASFDHINTLDSTDANNVDVADVFAIPADRLVNLVEKDFLAEIPAADMASKIGGYNDYDKGLGGNFKLDGKYFAFPYNIETLIAFVNEKNAEAEGFAKDAKYELNDIKTPSTMLLPVSNAWFGVALTNTANIELLGKTDDGKFFSDFSKDWKDLEPEKQAVMKSIFEYWKKHFDSKTALFDKDAGSGYIDTEFSDGNKGVVRLEGPWATGSLKKFTGDGASLGIYPIDKMTINGKPFSHWKGGWGLVVNVRDEEDKAKMELAEAMISEIVNPKFAVDLFKATGKVLENVSAETYEASSLNDVDKKVITAVIKSYANAPARPLFKEWGRVWDTWQNAILSWNTVKPNNVEAAYAQVQLSFKGMLENLAH